MTRFRLLPSALALAAAGLLVAACEGTEVEHRYPDKSTYTSTSVPQYGKPQSVFGEGGLQLFGGGKRDAAGEEGGGGIGVNSYLWRASLDTVSFMPLASADPFGGVIITDWYDPPETPGERYKVTIYILDRQLRADGLRVAVFKQRQGVAGWENAPVDDTVGRELENKILTRARELRIASKAQ